MKSIYDLVDSTADVLTMAESYLAWKGGHLPEPISWWWSRRELLP
jgi:hypothetical protein